MIAMYGEIKPHAPPIPVYPQVPYFHIRVEYTFSTRIPAVASRGLRLVPLKHIFPRYVGSRAYEVGEITRERQSGVCVRIVDVVPHEEREMLLVLYR